MLSGVGYSEHKKKRARGGGGGGLVGLFVPQTVRTTIYSGEDTAAGATGGGGVPNTKVALRASTAPFCVKVSPTDVMDEGSVLCSVSSQKERNMALAGMGRRSRRRGGRAGVGVGVCESVCVCGGGGGGGGGPQGGGGG